MKKYFYIAREDVSGVDFKFQLIKRCDSYEEALVFLNKEVIRWQADGYKAQLCEADVVCGAIALDEDGHVKHSYQIFESPCFFAGGSVGL